VTIIVPDGVVTVIEPDTVPVAGSKIAEIWIVTGESPPYEAPKSFSVIVLPDSEPETLAEIPEPLTVMVTDTPVSVTMKLAVGKLSGRLSGLENTDERML
jgi:hypothetical protein